MSVLTAMPSTPSPHENPWANYVPITLGAPPPVQPRPPLAPVLAPPPLGGFDAPALPTTTKAPPPTFAAPVLPVPLDASASAPSAPVPASVAAQPLPQPVAGFKAPPPILRRAGEPDGPPAVTRHPRINEVPHMLLDDSQQMVIVWQVAGDIPRAWIDYDTAFSERLERHHRSRAAAFEEQPGTRHRYRYDPLNMLQTNVFYTSQRAMRRAFVPIDHWFSSGMHRVTVETNMKRMWSEWEAANEGEQASAPAASRARPGNWPPDV